MSEIIKNVIFLDCEASSLSSSSYPIEIAWSDENGAVESYLINAVNLEHQFEVRDVEVLLRALLPNTYWVKNKLGELTINNVYQQARKECGHAAHRAKHDVLYLQSLLKLANQIADNNEFKITRNCKMTKNNEQQEINFDDIDVDSLVVILEGDYPELADSFFESAKWKNGVQLTSEEVDCLNDEHAIKALEIADNNGQVADYLAN